MKVRFEINKRQVRRNIRVRVFGLQQIKKVFEIRDIFDSLLMTKELRPEEDERLLDVSALPGGNYFISLKYEGCGQKEEFTKI